MPPLESSLLRAVERRLKAVAARDPTLVWRKRFGGPMAKRGDPDLHGVWRGTPFEIELKRPGEEPSPLQTHRLAEWRRAGSHTFVVHSLAEYQTAIDTLRQVVDQESPARPAPGLNYKVSREK